MIYDASNINTRQAYYFESLLISGNIKIPLLSGVYPDKGQEPQNHTLIGTIGFDSNGNAIKMQFSFGQTALKMPEMKNRD